MNIIDICLCVLLAGGLALGYTRGFVSQLFSIAGMIVAFIVAYRFYRDVSPWLASVIPITSVESFKSSEPLLNALDLQTYIYNALAFAIVFFAAKLVLASTGRLLNFIVKAPGLNFANKTAGATLAVVEAALIAIVAVNVMQAMPSPGIQESLSQSRGARYIEQYIPSLTDQLRELWKRTTEKKINGETDKSPDGGASRDTDKPSDSKKNRESGVVDGI